MYLIKKYLYKLAWLFLITLSVFSYAQEDIPEQAVQIELTVFKTPSCGCCKKWVSHIEEQGIATMIHDLPDLSDIKSKYDIKPNYRSCHTGVSKKGYIFEGHVPAKFINQFIEEGHPNALGLSVPGMPLGSPGMEVGERFMPYKIMLLLKDGSSQVYSAVNHYEEQF